MNYVARNYIVKNGHYVVWKDSDSTGGHPKDKIEVCVKCGLTTAHLVWNGEFYMRKETAEIHCHKGA